MTRMREFQSQQHKPPFSPFGGIKKEKETK